MKYLKIIFILLALLITFNACRKNKKKIHAMEKKIKILSEKVINDSIQISSQDNNFSVNIINSEDGLISNNIRQIMFEKDNILCLTDKGIIRIIKDTGHINFIFIDNNANFFCGKLINKKLFIIDEKGLYTFYRNKLTLIYELNNIIPELIEISDWIYFFSSKGNFYHLKTNSTNVSLVHSFSNITFDHAFKGDKNILLSASNTLYSLNVKTLFLSNIISISNENINYVLKDEDKFYFGGKTLYEFDIKNKITTKIISIVSNDFLTYIYKEGNDLYIGKNKGISLVDLYIDPNKSETLYKKDEILEKFAVKNSYINHIEKSENILWISTKNNGIIKYIQNNP